MSVKSSEVLAAETIAKALLEIGVSNSDHRNIVYAVDGLANAIRDSNGPADYLGEAVRRSGESIAYAIGDLANAIREHTEYLRENNTEKSDG